MPTLYFLAVIYARCFVYRRPEEQVIRAHRSAPFPLTRRRGTRSTKDSRTLDCSLSRGPLVLAPSSHRSILKESQNTGGGDHRCIHVAAHLPTRNEAYDSRSSSLVHKPCIWIFLQALLWLVTPC